MHRKKNLRTTLFCMMSLLTVAGCQQTTLTALENSGQGGESVRNEISGEEIVEMLPPERPSRLGGVTSSASFVPEPPPAPQVAAISPSVQPEAERAPVPVQGTSEVVRRPTSPAEIVAQANQFFNGFNTLSGSFTQIGNDRKKQTGQVYLLRPGRMRFDYDTPSTLQIIADGQNVAVRNTQTGRQDLYPVSQTPLQFLLRREIRLDRDLKVINTRAEKEGVMITVEDRSTLGGTARITLFFDPTVTTLKSWDVTDAQGKKTTVLLSRTQTNIDIGGENFVIPMKYRN